MQDLMGRVVSEQPDDPYGFLIHVLERKANQMVSVCLRNIYTSVIFSTHFSNSIQMKSVYLDYALPFFSGIQI